MYPSFPILPDAELADGPTILHFVIRHDHVPACLTEAQLLQAEHCAQVAIRRHDDEHAGTVAAINRAIDLLAWSIRRLQADPRAIGPAAGPVAPDVDGGRLAPLQAPVPSLPPAGVTRRIMPADVAF